MSVPLQCDIILLTVCNVCISGTIKHYNVNNDIYSECFLFLTIVMKTLTCFTNNLLNYYTTAECNQVSATKIAMKVSTFIFLM